jgi:peptide chain release factor subunit 3
MDHMPMVDRKINFPLMMPLSEKYKDMGTIIVGKVESGHLRKGDHCLLMPNKNDVEVAAIYNEIEAEVSQALCGDNVRVRLRGVEDEEVSPGFVLTSPLKPVHAVRQFEAQLAILEHKSIICAGYSAVMHIHTLGEEVTLAVSRLSSTRYHLHKCSRPFCTITTKLLAGNPRSLLSSRRKVSYLSCARNATES